MVKVTDIEAAMQASKYPRERSAQSWFLDEDGKEQPNPTPMQPPVGYKRQLTIAEQMRQAIRQASFEAAQAGAETEEEANDFDVDEDYDPTSPWENDFEIDPAMEAMLAIASKPPEKPKEEPAKPSDVPQSSVPATE